MGAFMKDNLADASAAVTATGGPVILWLAEVNVVLTFVSLVLGILFLLWRWHRYLRRIPEPGELP